MATEAIELEPDAFMALVTEEKLQVEGSSGGYLYTGKRAPEGGWKVYKTRAHPKGWLYQARRVATQGVGGGTITVRIQVPSGTTARLVGAYVQGPASAVVLNAFLYDEDAAQGPYIAAIGAGASRIVCLPSIGQAATTSGNVINSTEYMLSPGQSLSFESGVALQNETLTVYICLLMSTETTPTWTVTGGVATLAASTISAANTLQAVYLV